MTEEKAKEASKEEAPEEEAKALKKKAAKPREEKKGKAVEKPDTGDEEEEKGGSQVDTSSAVPAQVVKVFKKVGLYGECYQCLARVLEGKNKGTLLRRNVRGPVRENDLLMLKETERDARAI